MNIEDFIKAINESKQAMDGTAPVEDKYEIDQGAVQALAEHMNTLPPAEMYALVQRLTKEIERNRMGVLNRMLIHLDAFEAALDKLHRWRAENDMLGPGEYNRYRK